MNLITTVTSETVFLTSTGNGLMNVIAKLSVPSTHT